MEDCDCLLGVKEVPIEQLIPNKTYFFFSHTTKEQPYNRALLQAVLEKNIRLIDYEHLTDASGRRVIAFGHFAGMVGAHNALWTWGQRTGDFTLQRMKDHHDYAEAREGYRKIQWPALRIVLTGTGRVAGGAAQVLQDMGVRKVSPEDYLSQDFSEAVFTQLGPEHYVAQQEEGQFVIEHFFEQPEQYHSIFQPYTRRSDIMINGIYWDNRAPAFFTAEEMTHSDFSIRVIADVTCDIAPTASIPSTLRATTIADPVMGYDPKQRQECAPYREESVDMMTIDNLPNELPRDASQAFGEQFLKHVLPALLREEDPMIEGATIARDGRLTKNYAYLEDFVRGTDAQSFT